MPKTWQSMATKLVTEKLAQYGTDGRLFATDVSAKFKVTRQKLRQKLKIRPRQALSIVP